MGRNYRAQRTAYLNCEKRIFDGVGRWNIPELRPTFLPLVDTELISFKNAIHASRPEDKIVHFYIDDYQFERVWNLPDKYISVFQRFKAILQPDFSLYTDFPPAVNLFNHYRKQWVSAYWQSYGIEVIPTICWALPESYDYCFDGVPKHSLISISTIGGCGSKAKRQEWLDGYRRCLEVTEPSHILLFGKKYDEIEFDGPMTVVESDHITKMVKERKMNNVGKKRQ